MEDDYPLGSGIVRHSSLAPKRCVICPSKHGLLRCGSCNVVNYCGTAHQSAHRPNHRAVCVAIKQSREVLEREEATLRAHPGESLFMPADVFNTGVGRFWSLVDTRDYMRARFAAADALLRVDTLDAAKKALWHFTDMLRLCRADNLGVRDIVPGLLLRLGREQECYDFLKWWAVVKNKDRNGTYALDDVTLPYLDIRGANAFEPIGVFCSGGLSLSHLANLTLLKLRMCLDLDAAIKEIDHVDPDQVLGTLVRAELPRFYGHGDVMVTAGTLRDQYHRLCRAVNDANPYFWEVLVDETEEPPSRPQSCVRGSREEAYLALNQCLRAWQESEDAILTIESDTSGFARAYKSPATVDARVGVATSEGPIKRAENVEKRRATGDVFPTKFEPPLPTSRLAELFPPTLMSRGQTVRFVCRNDGSKVLAYVDGACGNNGKSDPRAGWAVVYGPYNRGDENGPYVVSGRLENKGPFGDASVATSKRAELRAVIAVLRLCDWRGKGFDSLVIATDSSYVVDGATDWAKGWLRNGWKDVYRRRCQEQRHVGSTTGRGGQMEGLWATC